MTLPASGQIAMSQVNTELGRSSTAQLDLGGTNPSTTIRTLAGVSSGQIGLSNLRGKSAVSVIRPSIYSNSLTWLNPGNAVDSDPNSYVNTQNTGGIISVVFPTITDNNTHTISVTYAGSGSYYEYYDYDNKGNIIGGPYASYGHFGVTYHYQRGLLMSVGSTQVSPMTVISRGNSQDGGFYVGSPITQSFSISRQNTSYDWTPFLDISWFPAPNSSDFFRLYDITMV